MANEIRKEFHVKLLLFVSQSDSDIQSKYEMKKEKIY